MKIVFLLAGFAVNFGVSSSARCLVRGRARWVIRAHPPRAFLQGRYWAKVRVAPSVCFLRGFFPPLTTESSVLLPNAEGIISSPALDRPPVPDRLPACISQSKSAKEVETAAVEVETAAADNGEFQLLPRSAIEDCGEVIMIAVFFVCRVCREIYEAYG